MTTFFVEGVKVGAIDLGEDAAHHAKVKRLSPGDRVQVTDGEGKMGIGQIAAVGKTSLGVEIHDVREFEAPPEIHLYVPVADRDRMLWVAEKVTELQVSSWIPVMYERSKSVSPRGEGDGFTRKVLARMISALQQSGGAWLPAIHPIRTVDEIAGDRGVVLEQDSPPLGRWAMTAPVKIAVGPEGGFTEAELAMLVDGGWTAASLGDITLRFETAAVGAVAVARAMT